MRRIALVLAAMPMAANAVTIDFDSAPQNSIFGPTYTEDGYQLTGSNFAFPQISDFAFTTFANDGSLTLNYKGPTYTLTKVGGGAFSLASLQLGNVNGSTFGGTLQIAFDGGTATSFAIPMTNTLSTFAFNAGAVTSVAFSYLPGETANNTLNSYARLDNLVVNPAAAVPEPASWAMMIAGFGAIGTAMRRRQRVRVELA